MSTVESIEAALTEYHERFRHPSLQKLKPSGLYQLFPEEGVNRKAQYHWDDRWPDSEHPGVYFVLCDDLGLLYVGKTNNLGVRLSTYFRYAKATRSCEIKGPWKVRPSYLLTAKVCEHFEASSLEEFLIAKFKPPENKLGKDVGSA